MRKIRAYLNVYNAVSDIDIEFEVEDDATNDEIEKEAFRQVMDVVECYWDEVKEE